MKIKIGNLITGEVVQITSDHEYSDACKLSALRGVIRKWCKDGMLFNDFKILEWSSFPLWHHLQDYAYSKHLASCDLCGITVKCEDLEIVENNDWELFDDENDIKYVTCLNCSHTQVLNKVYTDENGTFTTCEECEGSYDVDTNNVIHDENWNVIK